MKQVAHKSPPPPRPRRLGVAEAKSRLSEILRDAAGGPTIIHSRGRDVAVVLAVEEYDRLTAERGDVHTPGARFLDRVEALKQQHGGGVDDFVPAPIKIQPVDPFARRAGARR
jgi:prevent-host-death family protein